MLFRSDRKSNAKQHARILITILSMFFRMVWLGSEMQHLEEGGGKDSIIKHSIVIPVKGGIDNQ